MNDLPITNSGVFCDGDLGKLGKSPNALSKESNLRSSDYQFVCSSTAGDEDDDINVNDDDDIMILRL